MYRDFFIISLLHHPVHFPQTKEPLRINILKKNQINGTPTQEVEYNLPKTNMTMKQK